MHCGTAVGLSSQYVCSNVPGKDCAEYWQLHGVQGVQIHGGTPSRQTLMVSKNDIQILAVANKYLDTSAHAGKIDLLKFKN